MSVRATRMEGWDSPVVRSLHEDLGHRLARVFQAGSGREFEHFGVIERVFDMDGLGLGRIGGGRVGCRGGFGCRIGRRRRNGWRGWRDRGR